MKGGFARALIEKTRDKLPLTRDEIRAFITGFLDNEIVDYQMSAWLMAACINGLSLEETVWLTETMRDSGDRVPRPSDRTDYWIDKHSTGGVGDKTSLILVPLVATVCEKLLGKKAVKIPMVSGRGLGYTGGTLDKLESVPGFSPKLSLRDASSALDENSFFMMGQTAELAPADRRIYALRDTTATVESIELIVASILSKKLAENLDGLVIDLKWGSGAFMRDAEAGRSLGKMLVRVAEGAGVEAVALLSRMDEPLGWTAGHALEVQECHDYVRGIRRERGLDAVTLGLAGQMVSMASRGKVALAAAVSECEAAIGSRELEENFYKMFSAQGGDWQAFEKGRDQAHRDLVVLDHLSPSDGYVARVDAGIMGRVLWHMGAGRARVEDHVDKEVGLRFHKKVGDRVARGEKLVSVYCRTQKPELLSQLAAGVNVSDSEIASPQWLSEVIHV